MQIFHAFIIGFALVGCFVGNFGIQVAQESSHFFVDAVGFPVFPANAKVGMERGEVKGE